MSVRLIPVNDSSAMLRVDLVVSGSANRAAVGNVRGLDTSEDRVELFLGDTETEVKDRIGIRGLVKIQS